MKPALIVSLLALAACGPPPKETGTAVLRFSASSSVKNNANVKNPLLASVRGGIFLAEDVSLSGPRKGAEVFGSVKLEGVDLRTADVSSAETTTGELKPGLYTVLAMMDLNGNANAESPSPDPGDLVTVPLSNKLEITAGDAVKKVILFDLVFN